MTKHFGIPYMGSKDKIAPWILRNLPPGKRFVDLFGGGFAMSHAALLSDRYETVLYNELNPLVVDLVKRACAGEFNYNRFKPEFVSRERFEAEKEKDGYIKYIWSFGNSGHGYLFGKDVEPVKKIGHDYVVFGIKSDLILLPTTGTIRDRRIRLHRWALAEQKRILDRNPHIRKWDTGYNLERLQQLQQLERLQQLEQLERLERLQQLEITCGDYRDYKHEEGDVVYCDPPYENTAGYDSKENGFDSGSFYEWVATRDYQVFFSSFKISDDRFKLITAKRKRNLNGGARLIKYDFECLYANEVKDGQ